MARKKVISKKSSTKNLILSRESSQHWIMLIVINIGLVTILALFRNGTEKLLLAIIVLIYVLWHSWNHYKKNNLKLEIMFEYFLVALITWIIYSSIH
jgi:hypothetical protein